MPGNSVTAVATVKPQCILTLEVAWLVHTYRYVSRSVMSDSGTPWTSDMTERLN